MEHPYVEYETATADSAWVNETCSICGHRPVQFLIRQWAKHAGKRQGNAPIATQYFCESHQSEAKITYDRFIVDSSRV